MHTQARGTSLCSCCMRLSTCPHGQQLSTGTATPPCACPRTAISAASGWTAQARAYMPTCPLTEPSPVLCSAHRRVVQHPPEAAAKGEAARHAHRADCVQPVRILHHRQDALPRALQRCLCRCCAIRCRCRCCLRVAAACCRAAACCACCACRRATCQAVAEAHVLHNKQHGGHVSSAQAQLCRQEPLQLGGVRCRIGAAWGRGRRSQGEPVERQAAAGGEGGSAVDR